MTGGPFDPEFSETLKVHLEYVLEVVVDTFQRAGVALPERQYITAAQAAHDCEQVTASFEQLYIGGPGDQAQLPQRCDAPRTASVLVEIVRCIPTVNNRGVAPTTEALTASAGQQMIDAWLLLEAGTLVNTVGVLADVAAGQAQGGFQAISLTITTSV